MLIPTAVTERRGLMWGQLGVGITHPTAGGPHSRAGRAAGGRAGGWVSLVEVSAGLVSPEAAHPLPMSSHSLTGPACSSSVFLQRCWSCRLRYNFTASLETLPPVMVTVWAWGWDISPCHTHQLCVCLVPCSQDQVMYESLQWSLSQ